MMTQNTWGHRDKDGVAKPWIEIYNNGEIEVNIAGWSLQLSEGDDMPWIFPDITMKPNDFLVVFVSGEDQRDPAQALHTSFEFNGGNSIIEIKNTSGTLIDKLGAAHKNQIQDVSFGHRRDNPNRENVYLWIPTPAAANSDGEIQYNVRQPVHNLVRGYYDEPIDLLVYAHGGAEIYYSTDGSVPSINDQHILANPINIDKNTIVRTLAVDKKRGQSTVQTQTYLFAEDVIGSDHMDPSIVNDPIDGPQLKDSLLSLPALSVVTTVDIDQDVTLPASIEFFDSKNSEASFQIDCGVKYVGGHSLRNYAKKSMRFYFKSEFGPEKLVYPLFNDSRIHAHESATQSFDQLHMRSGSHDSIFYLGSNSQPPANAQYIRNRWMQDTMFRMGQLSTHGRFVQVYLNGNYHGIYHIQERPTQSFMSSYRPGSKEDYGYVNSGRTDDIEVWEQLKASLTSWEKASVWIDMQSLIDNQLLHYYAGNDWDWLEKQNWMAAGPRKEGRGGWKFFPWDSDMSFISDNANNTNPLSLSRTNNPMNAPDGVFTLLRTHPEFLALINERVQMHFYGDGALTPLQVQKTYRELADHIELPLIAESARWGNELGHRWRVDNDFLPEKERLLNSYFVKRTAIVIKQLSSEGLIP